MKIGIITIGSELLNGSRLDTNAHWIAKNVILFGGEIISKSSILDNKDDIFMALDNFLNRDIDMIIITGGLGPTHDDITATSLYKYFNDKPVIDTLYFEELKDRFTKKGFDISNLNKSQALIPSDGDIIPNQVGTARGLSFKSRKTKIIALPGVPSEMKSMMRNSIFPMIQDSSKLSLNYKILRTTGIYESELFSTLRSLIDQYSDVDIAFLPSFLGVDIRVSSKNKTSYDAFLKDVNQKIDGYIFSNNNASLEEVVAKTLIKNKISISTAESCTGGLIADRLTNISGVSAVYKGSIIAYSNDQKMKLLNVSQKILNTCGAVSEETAIDMAIGVQEKFSTNIGISTTGIAGPEGGTNAKPIGLVFIGLAYNGHSKAYKFNFSHDRISNKMITVQAALNLLRKNVEKYINN
jgi:nicotinamide-nucleotide amidase